MDHCKQCGNAVPDPEVTHAMQDEIERLRKALAEISLCSSHSASSKEECGRIARAALHCQEGEK